MSSHTPLIRRLRDWLAMDVLLPLFYLALGSQPMFCDLAEDCPYLGEEVDDD